jgi:hypothetical protein
MSPPCVRTSTSAADTRSVTSAAANVFVALWRVRSNRLGRGTATSVVKSQAPTAGGAGGARNALCQPEDDPQVHVPTLFAACASFPHCFRPSPGGARSFDVAQLSWPPPHRYSAPCAAAPQRSTQAPKVGDASAALEQPDTLGRRWCDALFLPVTLTWSGDEHVDVLAACRLGRRAWDRIGRVSTVPRGRVEQSLTITSKS